MTGQLSGCVWTSTPRHNSAVNDVKPPTAQQLEVLRVLYEAEVSRRPPPSVREMARYLDIHRSSLWERLQWLVVKGLVTSQPERARSYYLTGAGVDWVRRYEELVE